MVWVAWEKMCTPKAEGGMGFKDLKVFNLTLLAKQGWRILSNPNSLSHKVLKAKYFAESNFMEAQLGHKPSYTWRSLMAAKEVIGKGLRWNIGNGRKVNIWADRWVPIPYSFKIIGPRPPYTTLDLVASLINSETGSWDISLVKENFIPHDVEAILSIPISPHLPDDSQIWTGTLNEKFTVRSAYHVAHKWLAEELNKVDGGSASNSKKMSELWGSIWGLQCQNRVKQFLWRACKNILPTNYNLKLRKVAIEDKCAVCGNPKSSGHVLWDCVFAIDIWKETRLILPKFQNP